MVLNFLPSVTMETRIQHTTNNRNFVVSTNLTNITLFHGMHAIYTTQPLSTIPKKDKIEKETEINGEKKTEMIELKGQNKPRNVLKP